MYPSTSHLVLVHYFCRCIRLSIVHDVAEGMSFVLSKGVLPVANRSLGIDSFLGPAAIVGDITPNDGISKEEKRRLEANAIVKIQEMLGTGSAAGSRAYTLPALNNLSLAQKC